VTICGCVRFGLSKLEIKGFSLLVGSSLLANRFRFWCALSTKQRICKTKRGAQTVVFARAGCREAAEHRLRHATAISLKTTLSSAE
jgi:hypothetical protein